VPTYQYACTECGNQLEAVQSFSDAPLTECPACTGRLRKVFSSVGVVFKGSGFYRTDSRDAAKGKNGGAKDGAGKDTGVKEAGSKDSGDKAPAAAKSGSSSGDSGSGSGSSGSSGGSSTGAGGSKPSSNGSSSSSSKSAPSAA
jgi:putative FmdB family regulatory protein